MTDRAHGPDGPATPSDPGRNADTGAGEAAQARPPHLDESIRRIRAAGKDTMGSGVDAGRALRRLVSADLALARSSLGRALAWSAVSIVFGASAWLLAMGATIALLQAWGLSWLASLSIALLISLVVTGVAIWRVSVFFDHAGMHATRRQLARLGLFSEHDDDDDTSPPACPPGTGGAP